MFLYLRDIYTFRFLLGHPPYTLHVHYYLRLSLKWVFSVFFLQYERVLGIRLVALSATSDPGASDSANQSLLGTSTSSFFNLSFAGTSGLPLVGLNARAEPPMPPLSAVMTHLNADYVTQELLGQLATLAEERCLLEDAVQLFYAAKVCTASLVEHHSAHTEYGVALLQLVFEIRQYDVALPIEILSSTCTFCASIESYRCVPVAQRAHRRFYLHTPSDSNRLYSQRRDAPQRCCPPSRRHHCSKVFVAQVWLTHL